MFDVAVHLNRRLFIVALETAMPIFLAQNDSEVFAEIKSRSYRFHGDAILQSSASRISLENCVTILPKTKFEF